MNLHEGAALLESTKYGAIRMRAHFPNGLFPFGWFFFLFSSSFFLMLSKSFTQTKDYLKLSALFLPRHSTVTNTVAEL